MQRAKPSGKPSSPSSAGRQKPSGAPPWEALFARMDALTTAIERLAASNEALVESLMGEDEEGPTSPDLSHL